MYCLPDFKYKSSPIKHYSVKLPAFDGPFDLLYQLITKQKFNIWDVPIGYIVDQYMEHLFSLKEIQVSLAGEFLLMASSLLELKSRLLLPRLPYSMRENDEEAFYFGTKEDLVRSLLAYRRFKLLAEELRNRERAQHRIYFRATDGEKVVVVNMQSGLFPNSPETLKEAMVRLSKRKEAGKTENIVIPEELSFRSIMFKILITLKKAGNAVRYLDEFISGKGKKEIIVSFFAFLELARRRRLSLHQEKMFTPIRVFFPARNNKLTGG